MRQPLEIDFRDIPPSAGLAAAIRKRVGRLERLFDPIVGCRVTVGMPSQAQCIGSYYTAQVRLSVPGCEIVAHGEHPGQSYGDSCAAVLDAFDVAQRELEDYTRQRRGELGRHCTPAGMLV